MNQKEFKELIDKYFDGSISPREQQALEIFENEMSEEGKKDLYRLDGQPRESTKSNILRGVQAKIRLRRTFPQIKVAASIAALFALGFLGYYFMGPETKNTQAAIVQIVKTTGWGQKLTIDLTDGTRIRLNSGSTLKFPERFEGNERFVELEGEAFFEVAPDPERPFIIRSGALKTEVLGTSFNVQSYPERENVEVTVATGRVKVASWGKQEAFLEPSQQAVFHKQGDSIHTKSVDIGLFSGWKDGVIQFEDASLSDAVMELQRWFNVSITVENSIGNDCTFTGKFNNENLETVLRSISNLKKGLKVDYITKDSILIKGKCN